jgi:hypothetical protein
MSKGIDDILLDWYPKPTLNEVKRWRAQSPPPPIEDNR